MKYLLIVFSFLFLSLDANAGAQLTIQNMLYKDLVPRPMIGIAIDQKIVDKTYFSGWAGVGSRPDFEKNEITKHWSTVKAGLDYRLSRVSFGGGLQMNASSDNWEHFYPQIKDAEKEYVGYLKVAFKLW